MAVERTAKIAPNAFIWEPTKGEVPALFDAKGNSKPEIDVYPELAKEYGKL